MGYYAGSLLAKLKIQQQQLAVKQQQHTDSINKQNNYLINSINLIAKAVIEQQCELSEGGDPNLSLTRKTVH